jgi:predicted RNA-binding Zn-ribbon protein involved in translation (DUF1610 family)
MTTAVAYKEPSLMCAAFGSLIIIGTYSSALKCPTCKYPIFKKKTGPRTAYWGAPPPRHCTNCGENLAE